MINRISSISTQGWKSSYLLNYAPKVGAVVGGVVALALLCIFAGMPPEVMLSVILISLVAYLGVLKSRQAAFRRSEVKKVVDAARTAEGENNFGTDDFNTDDGTSDSNNSEEEEELTADCFFYEQLYHSGMQPIKADKSIIFHYQGGCFQAQWLDKHVIRISMPCMLQVDVSCQNHLCRLLNAINSSFVVVKLTMDVSGFGGESSETALMVNGCADIYYTSLNAGTPGYLTDVLDLFFAVRSTLYDGIASIPDTEFTPEIFEGNYLGFSLN